MIIFSAIAILIYLFAIYFMAFRNAKWKSMSDKFVKYYRVILPTLVYAMPLSFHIYNGTDLEIIEFLPLFLGFSLWALTPFLLLVYLSGTRLKKTDLILVTTVMFAIELAANLKVHVFPGSSTDGLVFLPIYQMVIILPVSLLICYIIHKLFFYTKRMKAV
jgi:hypothetical protein